MTGTIVASEYASAQTALAVVCICIAFSAIVGRWWTLALPVVLATAILALTPIDAFYEGTPEDVQAGVVFGAIYGLGLAAAALFIRRFVTKAIVRRRKPQIR